MIQVYLAPAGEVALGENEDTEGVGVGGQQEKDWEHSPTSGRLL